MRSAQRRDDLGARLGCHDSGRAIVAEIWIGKLVDEPVSRGVANRATWHGDNGKMALIGGVYPSVTSDVAHPERRQCLEQHIEGAVSADPRNEVDKFARRNNVIQQCSIQIERL